MNLQDTRGKCFPDRNKKNVMTPDYSGEWKKGLGFLD